MRSKVDAIFTVTQRAKIGLNMQFWVLKKRYSNGISPKKIEP